MSGFVPSTSFSSLPLLSGVPTTGPDAAVMPPFDPLDASPPASLLSHDVDELVLPPFKEVAPTDSAHYKSEPQKVLWKQQHDGSIERISVFEDKDPPQWYERLGGALATPFYLVGAGLSTLFGSPPDFYFLKRYWTGNTTREKHSDPHPENFKTGEIKDPSDPKKILIRGFCPHPMKTLADGSTVADKEAEQRELSSYFERVEKAEKEEQGGPGITDLQTLYDDKAVLNCEEGRAVVQFNVQGIHYYGHVQIFNTSAGEKGVTVGTNEKGEVTDQTRGELLTAVRDWIETKRRAVEEYLKNNGKLEETTALEVRDDTPSTTTTTIKVTGKKKPDTSTPITPPVPRPNPIISPVPPPSPVVPPIPGPPDVPRDPIVSTSDLSTQTEDDLNASTMYSPTKCPDFTSQPPVPDTNDTIKPYSPPSQESFSFPCSTAVRKDDPNPPFQTATDPVIYQPAYADSPTSSVSSDKARPPAAEIGSISERHDEPQEALFANPHFWGYKRGEEGTLNLFLNNGSTLIFKQDGTIQTVPLAKTGNNSGVRLEVLDAAGHVVEELPVQPAYQPSPIILQALPSPSPDTQTNEQIVLKNTPEAHFNNTSSLAERATPSHPLTESNEEELLQMLARENVTPMDEAMAPLASPTRVRRAPKSENRQRVGAKENSSNGLFSRKSKETEDTLSSQKIVVRTPKQNQHSSNATFIPRPLTSTTQFRPLYTIHELSSQGLSQFEMLTRRHQGFSLFKPYKMQAQKKAANPTRAAETTEADPLTATPQPLITSASQARDFFERYLQNRRSNSFFAPSQSNSTTYFTPRIGGNTGPLPSAASRVANQTLRRVGNIIKTALRRL